MQWWQVLISKAFGSLDKLSYAVLLAGLVYAVLSDVFEYTWNTILQGEVQRGFASTGAILEASLSTFVSGLIGISFEGVKLWVEGKRGSPAQIRAIGMTSLKSYYGQHHQGAGNLLDFLVNDVMEPAAARTSPVWEDLSTVVTLRPSTIADHFEWEEQRTHTIYCESESCSYPLLLETSYKVDYASLEHALGRITYKLTVDGVVQFDFQQWFARNKDKASSAGFKIESEGVLLEYNGTWLRVLFSKDYQISKPRTPVASHERTLISSHDRCYALFLRCPTKRLRATLSIDVPDWIVKQPDASAAAYNAGNREGIGHIESDRTATVNVPAWTLPGIGLIAEWAPR